MCLPFVVACWLNGYIRVRVRVRAWARECTSCVFFFSGLISVVSGWQAARSDEHQFRAKIKVSTLAVFELSSFDKWKKESCAFR